MKLAVVSTQRRAIATLESFLRWHLDGAKFDCVYLYFDAPADDADSIALCRSPQFCDRVTALEADAAFRIREQYTTLPSWDAVATSVISKVQSRQRLNCEHCLRRCVTDGVRWLLHIDADECFVPADSDAHAHFARLDASGCWQFTYRNLEAVATTSAGDDDYFRAVEVFKQHEDELPNLTRTSGTSEHSALSRWLERAQRRVGFPVWFFFYSNGKSAIRVDAEAVERLVCAGVHGWAQEQEEQAVVKVDAAEDNSTQRADGWWTNIRKVARRSGLRTLALSEGAVVLHYACCTSTGFAAKDWRALGYLDGPGSGSWAKRWHTMQHQQNGADEEMKAEAPASADESIHEEHSALFGLSDEAEVERQVKAKVLVRCGTVRDFLLGRDPTNAAEPSSTSGCGEEEDEEDDEEEAEESARLRAEAHKRREERRVRWSAAGERLAADGYAIIDGFLGAAAAEALLASVVALKESDDSPFVLGRTGGGKAGKDEKFAERVVRGDQMAVLGDGEEARVGGLTALLRQADELISTMAKGPVESLRGVTSRSRPMLACYPGGGARYVRHLDNPGGDKSNGRLLTFLCYLNPEWLPDDGGMLRLHRPDDGSYVDVEPLIDRAVVFWSDARTPHEVLPANKPRWAVSAWYHHEEAKPERTCGGDGEAAGSAGGGVSEANFGNSTEEIESFLLAMLAMKGGGDAAREAKSKHFESNLRSW